MAVIAIAGFISSGKDSVADYLITQHGYKKISFASSLKDSVAAIFGWDRTLLDGFTMESRKWREEVDQWWAARLNMPNLTPRWILQHWGTEVCRTHFHNDIWVASVENQLRRTDDNIVITDCRFKNEFAAVKNANGLAARIHRGPKPIWYDDAVSYNKGPNGNPRWALGKATLDRNHVHASEYSSVGLPYDFVIANNGTMEELHAKIELMLVSQRSDHLDAKIPLCA